MIRMSEIYLHSSHKATSHDDMMTGSFAEDGPYGINLFIVSTVVSMQAQCVLCAGELG